MTIRTLASRICLTAAGLALVLIAAWLSPLTIGLRLKLAESLHSDARAIRAADQMLSWANDDTATIIEVAKIKASCGRRQIDQAVRILNSRIEDAPDNFRLYRARSQVRQWSGDLEDALLDMKTARDLVANGRYSPGQPVPSDSWFELQIQTIERLMRMSREQGQGTCQAADLSHQVDSATNAETHQVE